MKECRNIQDYLVLSPFCITIGHQLLTFYQKKRLKIRIMERLWSNTRETLRKTEVQRRKPKSKLQSGENQKKGRKSWSKKLILLRKNN